MKKILKIMVLLGVLFASLIGGGIYYASQKITPEQVRELIVTQLNKTFPGADVSLKEVKYKLGTSINFEINELDLKLKENRPGKELFEVGSAKVSIPIWTILVSGGEINIRFQNPKVSYYENKSKKNNWSLAMGDKVTKKKSRKKVKKEKKKADKEEKAEGKNQITFPVFLAKSKINIRFDEIDVNYKIASGMKGQFKVTKLLLKKVGLSDKAAYELQSKILLGLENNQNISSKILLIGTFDTPTFIKTKVMKATSVLKLEENKVSSLEYDIPNFQSQVNTTVEGGKIELKLDSHLGQLLSLKNQININGDRIIVEISSLEAILSEIASLVDLDKTLVNVGNSKITLNGDLKLKGERITPNLSLKLTDPITVKSNNLDFIIGMNGKFGPQTVTTHVDIQSLGGKANIDLDTKFPKEISNLNVKGLRPININVNAFDFVLTREFMQKMMYAGNPKAAEQAKNENSNQQDNQTGNKEKNTNTVAVTESPAPELPNVNIALNVSNVKLGDEILKVKGLVKVHKDTIGTKNIMVGLGQGKTNLNFLGILKKNGGMKADFGVDLKQIQLQSFDVFLPLFLKQIKGEFNGKINGKFAKQNFDISYDVKTDLDVKNGELKGLNLKSFLQDFIDKNKMLKEKIGKKDINIDDKFDRFILKGRFKHDHYQISQFEFIGVQNAIAVKGNGYLFPVLAAAKTGQLVMTLKDNKGKLGAKLKKNIGTDIIPLRLKGPQFALKPDYNYTLKKIAKSAAKTQGKRYLRKHGKKQLDKVTDKLLKGKANETVKKLFKGLFK